MRITRLYLRNYRVYEDPLELELPAGLSGAEVVAEIARLEGVAAVRWTG